MEFSYDKYVQYPRPLEASTPSNIILPSGNNRVNKDDDALKSGQTYWSMEATEDLSTMKDYFEAFYSQQIFNQDTTNLAVDGPSCCGKSSLIDKFKALKVNDFFNVQTGNSYNIFPTLAISYIYINKEFAKLNDMISDRSLISNIAYLMAYFIMNCRANGLKEEKTLHGICEELVDMHNLKSAFSYIRGLRCTVLIVMDSSFECSRKRMYARGLATGSYSDMAKSQCKEYHEAQVAAFSYIANILNFPCLDLNYVRKKYQVEDDTLIFQENASAFHKYNYLKNENYNLDIDVSVSSSGTEFFKQLQEIAIDLSYR